MKALSPLACGESPSPASGRGRGNHDLPLQRSSPCRGGAPKGLRGANGAFCAPPLRHEGGEAVTPPSLRATSPCRGGSFGRRTHTPTATNRREAPQARPRARSEARISGRSPPLERPAKPPQGRPAARSEARIKRRRRATKTGGKAAASATARPQRSEDSPARMGRALKKKRGQSPRRRSCRCGGSPHRRPAGISASPRVNAAR